MMTRSKGRIQLTFTFFRNDITSALSRGSTVWMGTWSSFFLMTSANLDKEVVKAVEIGAVNTLDLEANYPESTIRI